MPLGATPTVCPRCLRRLDGTLVRRGDEVWLRRVCPEHGEAEALVWRGAPGFDAWREAGSGSSCCEPAENPACPTECGLCSGHARQTCCVLLEVTQRCDLACPVCFAAAGDGAPADPSIATIEGWYRRLLEVAPGCNVQLSGGEPTVRDDLPEVVALGRALGHGFLQLNTNGLRLAREAGYAERLAEAGLSTVFLQFDGVDDAPYLRPARPPAGRRQGAGRPALRRGRPGRRARADGRARREPRPPRRDPRVRPGARAGGARRPRPADGAAGPPHLRRRPRRGAGDAARRHARPGGAERRARARSTTSRPATASTPCARSAGSTCAATTARWRRWARRGTPAAAARPAPARPSSRRRTRPPTWRRAGRSRGRARPAAAAARPGRPTAPDQWDAIIDGIRAQHLQRQRHGVPGRLDARPRPPAPLLPARPRAPTAAWCRSARAT